MAVYAGGRAVGLALALVATLALLGLRLAVAPTAAGFRHAMAAAPAGALYEADPDRGLVLAAPDGSTRVLGRLPAGLPLALAADQERLLLGTDRGLYQSNDAGTHWTAAAVTAGRYSVVWARAGLGLAGSWAGHLWRTEDAGLTWEALPVPAGDDEFQAVAVGAGGIYLATLAHVLRSFDAGHTWEVTGLPARVTALKAEPDLMVAATWSGERSAIDFAGTVTPRPALPAGVWALAGDLAATVDGVAGLHGTPLDHREVTALVSAGGSLYAGVARGPVYVSGDGGRAWRQVSQG